MSDKPNDSMSDGKAIGILGTALLKVLEEKAGSRREKAEEMGFVHTIILPDDTEETYLIVYSKDDSFRIDPIDPKQYRDGSLLYFYENEEDSIVQSTLRDEPLLDFEEL
jgi:hypothetical protein